MSDKKVTIMDGGQLTFSQLAPKPDKPELAVDARIIPNWHVISNLAELNSAILDMLSQPVIGLDIETTGLSPHEAEIRLIQVAVSQKKAYIIDTNIIKDISLLEKVFAAPRPIKVMHNAAFELSFLYCKHQLAFEGIFDSMLASQILHAGFNNRSHSLQATVMRELSIMLDKDLQTSNWERPQLSKAQLDYAALDASIMLPLREAMVRQLVEQNLVEVAKLEFDCVKAVAAMTYHGLHVDLAELDKIEELLISQRNQALATLTNSFGPINFNSPKQLQQAFRQRGIVVYSTREYELQQQVSQYPVLEHLLEYKKISKELSSFVKPLKEHLHPQTKRIHPHFRQNGTVAGRMSSTNPNTQSFPRGDFRRVICAPPNKRLIIADYSQVELRIIAEIARDKRMIKAYNEGLDLHKLTASMISGKQLEDITKDERQKAKAVNFGLIYGMGADGLVSYARYSYGVTMTKAEAEQIIHSFFRHYAGVAQWHQKARREGKEQLYTCTLSGRRRYYAKNQAKITELYNTPVQGTGADIIKAALINLHGQLWGSEAKIINCVHDEIVVECPAIDASKFAAVVEQEMVKAGQRFLARVPVVVDVNIADNWAEK